MKGDKICRDPKKDSIIFNMRADAAVMKRFTAYCEEVGQAKTLAFERIVTAFLDQYEAEKRQVEELKKKMEISKLETVFTTKEQ